MSSHHPLKSSMIMRRYAALKKAQAARDGKPSAPLAKRAAIEYFRQVQIEVFNARRDRHVAEMKMARAA